MEYSLPACCCVWWLLLQGHTRTLTLNSTQTLSCRQRNKNKTSASFCLIVQAPKQTHRLYFLSSSSSHQICSFDSLSSFCSKSCSLLGSWSWSWCSSSSSSGGQHVFRQHANLLWQASSCSIFADAVLDKRCAGGSLEPLPRVDENLGSFPAAEGGSGHSPGGSRLVLLPSRYKLLRLVLPFGGDKTNKQQAHYNFSNQLPAEWKDADFV